MSEESKRLTSLLRMMIHNQNGSICTNSTWCDVPLSLKDVDLMARAAMESTEAIMSFGEVVVRHEDIAAHKLGAALKEMFETQWDLVEEHHGHVLPMWLKSFVTCGIGFVDWSDLAHGFIIAVDEPPPVDISDEIEGTPV